MVIPRLSFWSTLLQMLMVMCHVLAQRNATFTWLHTPLGSTQTTSSSL
jgi:hypothetical protein